MHIPGFPHFEEQAALRNHLTDDRALCNKTFH